jgi:hypothetical protein
MLKIPDNYPTNAACSVCKGNFTELNSSNPYNISSQINQMGNTFKNMRNNIPHIKIGKDSTGNKGVSDFFTPQQEEILNKIKSYGIILIIAIVVGYAIFRIFF